MQRPSQHSSNLLDFLVIGLWTGILSGLLEALETLLLGSHPAISAFHKSGVEALWVVPIVNVTLLSVIALGFAILSRWFFKESPTILLLGILTWIGLYSVICYSRIVAPVGTASLSLGMSLVLCRAVRGRKVALTAFLRRNVLYLVLCALAIGAGGPASAALSERFAVARLPAAAASEPNVLLIVIDTLRADRLSTMGYSRPTTPCIDQLAREGVLFENAFATASWTLPSHAAMLTGRFTSEHGMDLPNLNVHNGFLELPQFLARYGYSTGMFSANTDVVTPDYFPAAFQHYDVYTPRTTAERSSLLRKIVWQLESYSEISSPPRRATTINDAFLTWVDRPRNGPFFALINYIDVHDHYKRAWPPPPPFDNLFGRVKPWKTRHVGPLSKQEVDLAYDEVIAYTDAQVGWLMKQLHDRGLDRDTLVILVSDHGESLLEHGRFGHETTLYREQIQVPIIFRYPGKLPAGIRSGEPVSLVNLPATILQLLKLPAAFPGEPLPIAGGQPQAGSSEEPLLSEFFVLDGPLLKSLLTSRWHYIANLKTGKEELFDFQKDPHELNNLSSAAEAGPVLEKFRTKLRERFPGVSRP